MNETQKTNRLRGPEFLTTYCTGKVIDIGCGRDKVTPEAEPFDLAHGDANIIDELRPHATYDCVNSSHCLEHMTDARDAARRWWRLVRPGGYMIIVVPDEDLYEQGIWPSRFNPGHRWSFRLGDKDPVWSPVSIDLEALIGSLPGAEVISAEVQDAGYDYSIHQMGIEEAGHQAIRHQAVEALKRLSDQGALTKPVLREILRLAHGLGATVDQTLGIAVAQLQVVARKQG